MKTSAYELGGKALDASAAYALVLEQRVRAAGRPRYDGATPRSMFDGVMDTLGPLIQEIADLRAKIEAKQESDKA